MPGKLPQNSRGLLIAVNCFASHRVASHYNAMFYHTKYNLILRKYIIEGSEVEEGGRGYVGWTIASHGRN